MDYATDATNTLLGYSGNIWVTYGGNVPTAEASFQGQIAFGGSIGRRVALHELAHWLGSGSVWQWNNYSVGGRFIGATTGTRIRALDGPNAYLNADGAHFWPYGLNYDSEFGEVQRNIQLVNAQRVDMGLGPDAATAITGTRRLQNRSSSLILQSRPVGTSVVQATNAADTSQQWRVTFADGFITIVGIDGGLSIEAQASGDNAATKMAVASDSTRQQWEMMPAGDGGWFVLRNRTTGNCLDNIGNLTANADIRLWGCGFHPNQQWRLVR